MDFSGRMLPGSPCGRTPTIDGIYFVAIAWQVYALSNAPTALSVVGVAWTLPTVVFLLVGGAISDRRERRRSIKLQKWSRCIMFIPKCLFQLRWAASKKALRFARNPIPWCELRRAGPRA